eukprot:c18526_g1_i1.p1 GENE.c18526_g1_i1~~c18526_g1_i1.p1  ORF type:complete len:270 (-),score=56.16 c18526_g1_i1:307-1116(-)
MTQHHHQSQVRPTQQEMRTLTSLNSASDIESGTLQNNNDSWPLSNQQQQQVDQLPPPQRLESSITTITPKATNKLDPPFWQRYTTKLRGKSLLAPANLRRSKPLQNALFCFFICFIAILPMAFVDNFNNPSDHWFILFVPLGASSTLVFGQPQSPFSQPPNLVLGHLISAFVGICCREIVSVIGLPYWCGTISVPTSILVMDMCRLVHPPGCSTALLASNGGHAVRDLGWMFIVSPVLFGALWLFVVAYLFNNLHPAMEYQYPIWWWWW